MRPIWHQRVDRVQAHISVSFSALVLWKTLKTWRQWGGLGNSLRTVLGELTCIQSNDVGLPTATCGEIRPRGVTKPDDSARAALP